MGNCTVLAQFSETARDIYSADEIQRALPHMELKPRNTKKTSPEWNGLTSKKKPDIHAYRMNCTPWCASTGLSEHRLAVQLWFYNRIFQAVPNTFRVDRGFGWATSDGWASQISGTVLLFSVLEYVPPAPCLLGSG